jgi:catalase-peroxidase
MSGKSKHGVFTNRPETLTNDFFVNLLDMSTTWQASATSEGVFEGRDRATGEVKWTAPASISSSARTPSSGPSRKSMHADDSQQAFVRDFVRAWGKVMNLDRFDLA